MNNNKKIRIAANAFIAAFILIMAAMIVSADSNFGNSTYGSGLYGKGNSTSEPSSEATTTKSITSSERISGDGSYFSFIKKNPAKAHKWQSVKKGKSATLKVDSKEFKFTKIIVYFNKDVEDIELKIEKLPSGSADAPDGKIYETVNGDEGNIKGQDVEKVIVQFKIYSEWLDDNNIKKEDAALYVDKQGFWTELETDLLSESTFKDEGGDFYLYQSEYTELGTFSISTKQKKLVSPKIESVDELLCVESWGCEPWGKCKGGLQKRECKDFNNCNTLNNKPKETKDCIIEEKSSIEESTNLIPYVVAIVLLIALILGSSQIILFYKDRKENYQHIEELEEHLSKKEIIGINKFIKSMSKAGLSKSQIERELVASGWHTHIIEKLFDESSSKKK